MPLPKGSTCAAFIKASGKYYPSGINSDIINSIEYTRLAEMFHEGVRFAIEHRKIPEDNIQQIMPLPECDCGGFVVPGFVCTNCDQTWYDQ